MTTAGWGETPEVLNPEVNCWVLVVCVVCAPKHRLKYPSRNGAEPLADPWNKSSNLLRLRQLPTVEGMMHETFEHHSCFWVKALPLPIIKQAVFWWLLVQIQVNTGPIRALIGSNAYYFKGYSRFQASYISFLSQVGNKLLKVCFSVTIVSLLLGHSPPVSR